MSNTSKELAARASKEYKKHKTKVNLPVRSRSPIKVPKGVEYYDLIKNWRKVKPHLRDPELNDILVRDMNKFTYGRRGEKFLPGMVPRQHDRGVEWENVEDADDWVIDEVKGIMYRTTEPEFWQYVCAGACHWLVNFNLRLAQLVEPKRPWRILTSMRHSAVWDGDKLLFEFNSQAFGASPAECFEAARRGGRELKVGERRRTYLAEHWRVAARRHDREQRRRFKSAGLARRAPAKAKDGGKWSNQQKQPRGQRTATRRSRAHG
jgi:hypothetical protein